MAGREPALMRLQETTWRKIPDAYINLPWRWHQRKPNALSLPPKLCEESEMPLFRLTPNQPFRLDLTSWVLRRRPNNTWDFWDGETYRRVLVVDGVPVDVSAVQRGAELVVTLNGARVSSQIEEASDSRSNEAAGDRRRSLRLLSFRTI